jgi:hypothetical protein
LPSTALPRNYRADKQIVLDSGGYRKGACPALSVQENDNQVGYRKCGSYKEENRRDPHDMIPRPANSPVGVFSCKEGDNKAGWEWLYLYAVTCSIIKFG